MTTTVNLPGLAQLTALLNTGTAQEIAYTCAAEWLSTLIPSISTLVGYHHPSPTHTEGDGALHTALVIVHLRNTARRRLNRAADLIELLAALIHELPATANSSAALICSQTTAQCGLSSADADRLRFLVTYLPKAHAWLTTSCAEREEIKRSPYAESLALLQEADALGTIHSEGSHVPVLWDEISEESIAPSYFDFILNRRAYDSLKWNTYPPEQLPVWVADMDFRSSPAIISALSQRVAHGEFGYERHPKKLTAAVTEWCRTQYNWLVAEDEVVPLPGLVCGLNVVAKAVGRGQGTAAVFTPVYPPFLTAPRNQGMTTLQIPLKQTPTGSNTFRYTMDFELFERSITPAVSLCILCHPHNPSGETWSQGELTQLAALCKKHNIVLCSDEIHCDLILDGTQHVPVAMASADYRDSLITLMAPSKTFNIPGLGYSFAIIQNKSLRQRFVEAAEGVVPQPNVFGLAASEAAYTRSSEWLRHLRSYLADNRDYAVSYIAKHMPELHITNPSRTYLLWIDCRSLQHASPSAATFFQREARVALNDGATFGAGGEGFVRLNLGAPRAIISEALDRMREAVRRIR